MAKKAAKKKSTGKVSSESQKTLSRSHKKTAKKVSKKDSQPTAKRVTKKVAKKLSPPGSKKVAKKAPQKAKVKSNTQPTALLAPQKISPSKSVEPISVHAEIVEDEPKTTSAQEANDYSHLPVAVTDGLTTYLSELRKYPLLTREEEEKIAKRYFEKGNPKDAELLVTSNLRFVVKVAAEYARFGAKLIDLIQEGNVGLMHAVKEFNPYKGVRLITYAVWWIKGYIQEYLMRQYSMVRIGTTQNQRKLFYNLEKEREKLLHEGMEVTPKLLSSRLGVSEDEIKSMELRLGGRDLSLDQPLDESSKSTLADFEAGDEMPMDVLMEYHESLSLLQEALEHIRPDLNEKETLLLEQRLLADEPKTLQEIGEEWHVTREAVRQMEVRVMKKLKTAFEEISHKS